MKSVSVNFRRAAMAAWDVMAWVLAFGMFVLIRYDFALADDQWRAAAAYTLTSLAVTTLGSIGMHFYLGRSRVGSYSEATSLAAWVFAVGIVVGLFFVLFIPRFPNGIAVMLPPLAMFMGSGRWLFRTLRRGIPRPGAQAVGEGKPRALVYGAGDDGHDVARLNDLAGDPPYQILGFLDDDVVKKHRRIRSYRVLGRGDDLVEVAQAQQADLLILAIGAATRELMDDVADQCRRLGIKFITVPPVRERIGGRVRLNELREFSVADLLGRRPIDTDLRAIASSVSGKAVLITGAGGSIGSELARQVRSAVSVTGLVLAIANTAV